MKRKRAYMLALTGLMAAFAFANCSGPTSTTNIRPNPLATSESRSSDGFEYDVIVSNVHPVVGDTVVITTELKNIGNTVLPANNIFGETTIEIKNGSGEVVWGFFTSRRASTLIIPISTGYASILRATWTATAMPQYGIQVGPGTFTITVSDTGIFDPTLDMRFPFSVTPIQITVYE